MKLNEIAKCPHCNTESNYIFYDNSDMLECNNCGKLFDIELETKIEVISSKPVRVCNICGEKFDSYGTSVTIKCPKCGCETYNYKY